MNEKTVCKFKKELKTACNAIGLEEPSYAHTGTNFERYWCDFATVAVSFDPRTGIITVEKYFDSEVIHNMQGESLAFTHTRLADAIAKAKQYLRSVGGDDAILGGIKDSDFDPISAE